MIHPNEAVRIMMAAHDADLKLAREKYVPYWMDQLNKRIITAAEHGYGSVTLELRWAERLGAAHAPSLRVQKYTEKILDEELARDTGYYIVKKSENDDHYARYEVWWYSEEYDAYKVEREATINGIEEEEDYPLPSLS